jgi:hypothetical protein
MDLNATSSMYHLQTPVSPQQTMNQVLMLPDYHRQAFVKGSQNLLERVETKNQQQYKNTRRIETNKSSQDRVSFFSHRTIPIRASILVSKSPPSELRIPNGTS